MTNYSKSVAQPALRDVLESKKLEIFDSFNCHNIGIIESFDVNDQTAEIKIVFKKVFENVEYEYPLLVECPVIFLGGIDNSLRFPIKKGDSCLVLFNDVNIDDWFEGTINKTPESNRRHDLSDGIALVGIRNLQNKITDFDADAVQLNNDDTILRLKEKILLGNEISDLKTLLFDLIDEVKAIITVGSAATQVVSPTSQNALENIKTAIGQVFES